jgi:hypothetical protein
LAIFWLRFEPSKLAADIAGFETGQRGSNPKRHQAWREKVEGLPLASLTPAKIVAWREAFVVRFGDDPVAPTFG